MAKPARTTIAVVHPHAFVRDAIAEALQAAGDYQVVVRASHGADLLAAMNGTSVAIALVEVDRHATDGDASIATLIARHPTTKVVAMAVDDDEDVLVRVLRAQAHGLLSDRMDRDASVALLRQVRQLGCCFTDRMHHCLLNNRELKTSCERERDAVMGKLTPREKQFLRKLCAKDEPTIGRIGKRMGVDERTAESFGESVREKFGIKGKAGLLVFAMKWGFGHP